MSDNNGLTFSDDALSNRVLYLSQYNDINFFVEDIGKEFEYEEIFERLFENQIQIFSIFPLGGKPAVISKQQECNIYEDDGKLNVFIVDGDFDNIWENKIIAPNLIYLTRYNIESYYCCKNAVIKYMRSFLRCVRSVTETTIQFDNWRKLFSNDAGQLFILFALVNHYCPKLPNVNLGAGRFLDNDGHIIAEEFKKYSETISNELNEPVEPYIKKINEKISNKFDGTEEDKILSVICGKFQFESLCRHLKSKCNRNIDRNRFRSALISSFDLEPLYFIKERVFKLYNNCLD